MMKVMAKMQSSNLPDVTIPPCTNHPGPQPVLLSRLQRIVAFSDDDNQAIITLEALTMMTKNAI